MKRERFGQGERERERETRCITLRERKHEKPLFHNARNKCARILEQQRELPERSNYDALKYLTALPFGVIENACRKAGFRRFRLALVIR